MTVEQYLEWDSCAERPSEYYDGVMYPIEATSFRHGRIQQNLTFGIRRRFDEASSSCEVLGPTIRVRLPNKRYAYPDVVIVCGQIERDDKKYDTLLNPTAIVEVLSPSTADFDRGGKADLYRAISTLKEYVIVAQDRMLVQRYGRQGEEDWHLQQLSRPESLLRLESIGVEIQLREIYKRVDFESEA